MIGKPRGISWRKWEDNIKIDLKETGCEGTLYWLRIETNQGLCSSKGKGIVLHVLN
jgi:hypothetical protein